MHGFSDLEGAEEIAPGTRIYRGGAHGEPMKHEAVLFVNVERDK